MKDPFLFAVAMCIVAYVSCDKADNPKSVFNGSYDTGAYRDADGAEQFAVNGKRIYGEPTYGDPTLTIHRPSPIDLGIGPYFELPWKDNKIDGTIGELVALTCAGSTVEVCTKVDGIERKCSKVKGVTHEWCRCRQACSANGGVKEIARDRKNASNMATVACLCSDNTVHSFDDFTPPVTR